MPMHDAKDFPDPLPGETYPDSARPGSGHLILFLIGGILVFGLIGVFFLLGGNSASKAVHQVSFPYYLADHLEDAVRIDTPVHRWKDSSVEPGSGYLFQEEMKINLETVTLTASPYQGRTGGGMVRISSPGGVTDSAAARLDLSVEGGTSYLLSGYTRYQVDEDLVFSKAKTPFVPEAAIAWKEWKGTAAPPGLGLVSPVPPPDEDDPERFQDRSGDLLAVMMHWRVSRRFDAWNYFEFPIEVPAGIRRLELSLECRSFLGEIQFTDLRLTPQDFASRALEKGSYRYLPSTEFTFPLKKMSLLGDTYRASLAGFTPSRFVFDLDLPERPVLEFHTGLEWDARAGKGKKVRFTVTVEDPGGGKAEVIHQSIVESGHKPEDWRMYSIGLDAHAGARKRITLETRFSDSRDETARPDVVPLWGTPVIYNRETGKARPSILLLSIDCTREDRLGGHGYARDCTPFLDDLAEKGVDFLNAYSPSDLTYVVMPMLMTGRMIKFKWLGSFNVLDPAIPSLPEILTREGYLCGGFCSDFYYNGFWKGFPFRPCIENKTQLMTDRDLLEKALQFIRIHPDTPLFTWIHLNGPHPPCDSNPPHDRFVRQEGLLDALSAFKRQAGMGEQASGWNALNRILYGGRPVSPGTHQEMMKLFNLLYDGNLAGADQRVNTFIHELETLGVLENTLLAVTSDHGIQLRPDGVSARGPREEGVRVPFILKGPGVPEGPLPIRSRVSTIDFMPTVLDILNIPAPPGLTGRSLRPLFEAEGSLPEKPVFSLLTDSIALWFDDYKYRVSHRRMSVLLEPGADLEGPPMDEEYLHHLAPGGKGDDENIAADRRDLLVRGRKILVDTWNTLDSSSARGPANQALVGFFKKAGYMK